MSHDPHIELDAHAPRRRFLQRSSLALAGLAGSALTANDPALAQSDAPNGSDQDADFRRRSQRVRVDLANANATVPIAPHPVNGDEERYPNRIGSDSRGLPHNARGEVDPEAWKVAATAFRTRDPADFEKIPLGGTRKLLNPIGTLAVNLEGLSAGQFGLPAAPALASGLRAAEAVELYWQALLRDVPFSDYRDDTTNRDILAAVDELNRLTDFCGPKVNGRVTPQTLFRGNAWYVDPSDASGRNARWVTPPGVLDGPVVSQFLYRDVPFGPQSLSARIRTYTPASEFLTQYDEWLHVQNGGAPRARIAYEAALRHVANGRDLAAYAHSPAAFNAIGNQLLSTPASASDPAYGGIFPASQSTLAKSNPYLKSRTQGGAAGTFGVAYFQAVLSLAVSIAIRVSYYQKWYEQRVLRPEAYAGLVHHRVAGRVTDYPIHESLLGSQALERSRARHGGHLLSHVYPEGAPIHSAYASGASIIGAVTATLLKAFYDESLPFPNPVQPDPSDPTRLIPWQGPPLTVGGELNKLALNYGSGRSWAGIHWRSDTAASYAQGEALVTSLLREQRATFREPFEGFSFTRFDGTRVTV